MKPRHKLSFALFIMLWDRDTNYRLSFLYGVVQEYKNIVYPFYNAVRQGYKLSFALFIMLWDGDTNYRLPLLYGVGTGIQIIVAL